MTDLNYLYSETLTQDNTLASHEVISQNIQDKEELKISPSSHAVIALTLSKTLHKGLGSSNKNTSDDGGAFSDGINGMIDKGVPGGFSPNGDGFNIHTKNNDGINWPVPSGGDSQNSPLNPNIPPGASESKILEELRYWLKYLELDKDNVNSLFGFVQFIINIQKHFNGKLPPAIQKVMGKIADIFDAKEGGSFAKMIITMMKTFYLYMNKGDLAKTQADMDALKKALDGLNTSGNPFLAQLKREADVQSEPSRLAYWVKHDMEDSNGKLLFTEEEEFNQIAGNLYLYLQDNKTLSSALKEVKMQMIDALIAQYGSNPILLVQLILGVMGESMSEQEANLGAYGHLSKLLQELAKENSDILNKFSKGEFKDGKAFKDFIAEMREILAEVIARSAQFGGAADSLNQAYQNFFSKFKVKLPDGKTYTLEQLIDDHLIGTGKGQISWDELAKDFNKQVFSPPKPPSGGGKTPGTGDDLYNDLIGGLNAASQAITGQSQGVQTEESNISSKINTIMGTLKKIILDDYYNGWIHTIVENTQRANS